MREREAKKVYIYSCTRVYSLQSPVSRLRFLPSTNFTPSMLESSGLCTINSQIALERTREWKMELHLTLPPASLSYLPPSLCSPAAFHILCASTSASHQVHCVPNGLRVNPAEPLTPSLPACCLPVPNPMQRTVSSSLVATEHSWHSLLYGAAAAAACCKFCLAAATLLFLLFLLTLSSKFDYKHCCYGQNK